MRPKMPKLYARFGTVSSGKSTALLVAAHQYGDRAVIWKASMDERTVEIHSRVPGLSRMPDAVIGDGHFPEIDEKVDCVFVDEASLLSAEDIDHLAKLTDRVPVICYALRTDWKGHAFEGSVRLFELADSIEEIKSICKSEGCRSKATHNQKLGEQTGPSVQLGFEDIYRPVCRRHFYFYTC